MKVIDLDDFETDTKDWGDYCLGYHSIRVPPGLVPSVEIATNIDWHYPKIRKNYPGSSLSFIESQHRFGGVVFKTRVNGWDFVVAHERIDEFLVSDFSLVFFGARRFGEDMVLFYQDASVSRVGDGSDPKYRQFYESLDAKPETPRNRNNGFCFDGYVFTGYKPRHGYSFWASFTSPLRHGYRLHLSQEMRRPPKDDRPLAPQSIPSIPDSIKVTEYAIRKNSYNGLVTKITGTQTESDSGFVKALIEGPYGDLYNPIIFTDTTSEIKAMSRSDGETEFLGFLARIQPNGGR